MPHEAQSPMEQPKRKRVCRESIAPTVTPTSGASGGGDAGSAASLTEEQFEQVRLGQGKIGLYHPASTINFVPCEHYRCLNLSCVNSSEM